MDSNILQSCMYHLCSYPTCCQHCSTLVASIAQRIKLLFLGVVTFTTSNILAQATASDCPDHVNICSDASFQVDPNGYGNVDELGDGFFTGLVSNPSTKPGDNGNSRCLLSG